MPYKFADVVGRNRHSMKRPEPALGGPIDSLEGYPNLSAAAVMLGVSVSTLSRRDDLTAERRGERDVVLPAGEVLRLAAVYRKRSLNDVAQALLAYVQTTSQTDVSKIEGEIESFFEARAARGRHEDFIDTARRLLPAPLVSEIERSLSEGTDELPDLVQGYVPEPKRKHQKP
jgi:hypothetical protein